MAHAFCRRHGGHVGFELDIYVPGRDTQTANCTQPNVSVTHAYVPTFHALYG